MIIETNLFQNLGWFDKWLGGRWDENSSCGWNENCKKTKQCIGLVCSPNRDAYGGAFYDSCINACNADNSMADIGDFLCKNPQNAWDLYNYKCPNFEPAATKGSIKIGNIQLSFIQIASLILMLVIVYLIIKRYE